MPLGIMAVHASRGNAMLRSARRRHASRRNRRGNCRHDWGRSSPVGTPGPLWRPGSAESLDTGPVRPADSNWTPQSGGRVRLGLLAFTVVGIIVAMLLTMFVRRRLYG